MFCFLLLSSMPMLLYVFIAMFIVLFSLQILGLILFNNQKKRFKKRIDNALSIQIDIIEQKTKLYCQYLGDPVIVDEKGNLFSLPDEVNEEHIFSYPSFLSNLPTKAYRVEIKHIKRSDNLDGPFKIYFIPGTNFTDLWKVKKIINKNEIIFEHPIMGELKRKEFPGSLKIGDTVQILQICNPAHETFSVKYKRLI